MQYFMPLPKPGETVKVTLRNGETIEGVVDWVNGNGAWVKNQQKARWIPMEALLIPAESESTKRETGEE